MIQIAPQMRIRVAIEPADFRRGIDGLARLVREELRSDPFSGGIFVFRNRRATAIKILVYDGQGFWLCQKRLYQGRFRYWPRGTAQTAVRALLAHELQVLLSAGDFEAARAAPPWRRIIASD
jgi:transposase